MTKVASTASESADKKKLLAKHSSEDIAIGVVIGIQCALALSVILYHVI